MKILPSFCVLIAFVLALPLSLHAQDYPAKPVRIIVPFQPGGGSDTLARLLAGKLNAKWGQPVIVENRAGAGGNLGAEFVAKSLPDGYTLLISSPGPVVINKSLYARLGFDPDGFVPVSIIATNYGVLAVHPKVGLDSIAQCGPRTCMDIALHLCSAQGVVPATSAQAFAVLAERGVIDPGLAQRLQRAVGFRNVLVHEYTELDWKIVIQVLRTGTKDLAEFGKAVLGLI